MQAVVTAEHIDMRFRLSVDKVDSLKELLIKKVKRDLRYEEFYALKDVSFKVWPGDILGIVGLNGSGKSTLLKLISGIMRPTAGTVSRVGSISPLIELGAGFSFDLTARENVFLNGAVLGFSKQYMQECYGEIIEFAELEQFQDVALKNFSSGMQARLGFSIATITKPDILIVDEVLSVGDFLFREKSEARIMDLMSGGTTVLLVSHSISQIRRLCNRALWLQKGQLMMDGETADVCNAYEEGAAR